MSFLSRQKPSEGVSTPFKRKQQKQVLLLLGVLLVIAIVLFWGFFGGASEPEFTAKTTGGAKTIFQKTDYQLGNKFLSGEMFSSYQIFGNHLVVSGEVGSGQPFVNFK